MKVFSIFTKWIPDDITFFPLCIWAGVLASIYILIFVLTFTSHLHFTNEAHLPYVIKKILCLFYHYGVDILVTPSLAAWIPFSLGKRTLGSWVTIDSNQGIIAMSMLSWFGFACLTLFLFSRLFIFPGNCNCHKVRGVWLVWSAAVPIVLSWVKVISLVLTDIPAISDPIIPASVELFLFLFCSIALVIFLPFRSRLGNQLITSALFIFTACSALSLAAAICVRDSPSILKSLFIASMTTIPGWVFLAFCVILVRYKFILRQVNQISISMDSGDLENAAVTETAGAVAVKENRYSFSWQVMVYAIVANSLDDPSVSCGILHYGVTHFPSAYFLWLAYGRATLSHDLQVSGFCLQQSNKLVPAWALPSLYNQFALDKMRRESEQKTEENTVRLLLSIKRCHEKALCYIHKFWSFLLSDGVNQQSLHHLVSKIQKAEKRCDELFKIILPGNKVTDNPTLLRAFAEYVRDIKQNNILAMHYLEMADHMESHSTPCKPITGKVQDNPQMKHDVENENEFMVEAAVLRQEELAQQVQIRKQLEISCRSKAFSRFYFASYFMQLVTCIVLLASFILARTAFKERESDYTLIAAAGGMRSSELQGAYGSRCLQLAVGGLRPFSFNITNYASDLGDEMVSLTDTAENLFLNEDTSYQAVHNAWHATDITCSKYHQLVGKTEVTNTSLWDMLEIYTSKVHDNVALLTAEVLDSDQLSEPFYYVIKNGPTNLWSGIWRLVSAYEDRFRAETQHTLVVTVTVLATCALLPLATFFLVLVPSLISLSREQWMVHQLFLQIPKASVSAICDKISSKISQKSASLQKDLEIMAAVNSYKSKRWNERKPLMALGALFLLVFALILCTIIVISGLALKTNSEYMDRALEINVAGSRRSLSLRMLTLLQEAIIEDSLYHTKEEMMTEFLRTTDLLYRAHENVKFGNKTLGLSGSVGRSSAQDSLLFDTRCDQYEQYRCMSLDTIMRNFIEMAHDLYTVRDLLTSFNFSLFLTFETLQVDYVMPLLSQSKKIYVAEVPELVNTSNKRILWIFCFALGLLFVLFFFVIRPSIGKVETEIHTTRAMLGMVPIDVIRETPTLLSFVVKGQLSDSAFDNSNERSRAIIMAAVDAVVELTHTGVIVSINPSGEQTTGYSASSIIGKHFTVLLRDDTDARAVADKLNQCSELLSTGGMSSLIHGKERQVGNSAGSSWSMNVTGMRFDGSFFPAIATLSLFVIGGKVRFAFFLRDTTPEQKHEELLREEKRMYEELLFSVLPRQIAYRLRNGEKDIVESVPVATVMFADIVQFTPWSASVPPSQVIRVLNQLFCSWDDLLLTKYTNIEKIKTIGDCYLCAAGLFDQDDKNLAAKRAKEVISLALDMIASLKETNIQIRVGVNTGPVFAGIVGSPIVKPTFDIFGSTVNVASRMESSSSANVIQMTRSTYELVYDSFQLAEHEVDVKGCGLMRTYTVIHSNSTADDIASCAKAACTLSRVAPKPHNTAEND
ncbi:PAS domain S-box protein [Pelomyxa schiedti]|nr:PAS domain S-box protein [Pelomyxa schiedti]